MPSSLWETSYVLGEGPDTKNIIKLTKNGEVRAYAVYSCVVQDEAKTYRILEMCADEIDDLIEVVNRIIENGMKEEIDFIYLKGVDDRYDEVLEEKGFFSFIESAIMVVLLNPEDFFSKLSQETEYGQTIKLNISGFSSIWLRVDKERAQIVTEENPAATINIDSKTFLKLLFGKTSFSKELIMGRITVDNVFALQTARNLFNLIKQDKCYMPSGDWL
jgi:predicted acetyltransferase